jgi:hypothetical protein
MEESEKPTFVIETPSFLGLPVNQDEERINKYFKNRSCPKIKSFYVHGDLESVLGYDICSFVSGEIKDIEEQESTIFDLNDKPHKSKIILVYYNGSFYGYLVSPKENTQKIKNEMINNLERYKSI